MSDNNYYKIALIYHNCIELERVLKKVNIQSCSLLLSTVITPTYTPFCHNQLQPLYNPTTSFLLHKHIITDLPRIPSQLSIQTYSLSLTGAGVERQGVIIRMRKDIFVLCYEHMTCTHLNQCTYKEGQAYQNIQ